MARRRDTARAVLTLLVMAALAGCATTAPASLTPPTTPPPIAPTDVLTPSDTTSRVGELAPGFPTDLLPVPPGAKILVSDAYETAPGSGWWNISLNVRSTQDTADLLDAVRGPLRAAGFTEQSAPAPAAGLAAQTTFSRAEGEVITVAIFDDGTARALTAGGTIMIKAPG